MVYNVYIYIYIEREREKLSMLGYFYKNAFSLHKDL